MSEPEKDDVGEACDEILHDQEKPKPFAKLHLLNRAWPWASRPARTKAMRDHRHRANPHERPLRWARYTLLSLCALHVLGAVWLGVHGEPYATQSMQASLMMAFALLITLFSDVLTLSRRLLRAESTLLELEMWKLDRQTERAEIGDLAALTKQQMKASASAAHDIREGLESIIEGNAQASAAAAGLERLRGYVVREESDSEEGGTTGRKEGPR